MSEEREMALDDVLGDIRSERKRQVLIGKDREMDENEVTVNDMIAVTLAYLGRASELVSRNTREGDEKGHSQREMLVKAATVLVATIEHDDMGTLYAAGKHAEGEA